MADPRDDASIRRLLRATPMPGTVTVAFEREPDYFLGCSVHGERVETPVIRAGGEVVGVCCRAVRRVYVGGCAVRVGYLGGLRVAPERRGRMLVARGMRFLRERQRDDPLDGYFATITEDNREADGVLVRRARPGFPAFEPLTTLHTLALVVARRAPRAAAEVRPATPDDLGRVTAFLNAHGSRRQLFPVVDDALFGSARTRGLEPGDLRLAFASGRLVGVLGLWDQRAYKQTVVRGYRQPLRTVKGLVDLALRVRGARPLPRLGERVRHASATFVCVLDDDPEVFAALLGSALREARRRDLHYLMVGLCDEDPLLGVARRVPHLAYRSTLHAVSFGGEEAARAFARRLEGVRHVDIATL